MDWFWVYIGIVVLFSIAMITEKVSMRIDKRFNDEKHTND